MARGVNKVILIGNLGGDPDVRFTQNQKQITRLNIATSDQWTDRATGQRQERTEWHRVVMFDRLAEIAGQYLKKGSKVYLEGRLQTNKWQDQNGQDRYTTEIIANDLQMLDSASSGSGQQQNYANANRSAPKAGAYVQPQQQPHYSQDNYSSIPPQGYAQQQPQHYGAEPNNPQQQHAAPVSAPPPAASQPAQPASQPQVSPFDGDLDDDIPF